VRSSTLQVADRRMPPRKRSAAQLAAAARGTATSKARKLDNMLSAVASLPDDEAIENMTADVVDDLLKRDVDTIDWHHRPSKIISQKAIRCSSVLLQQRIART